jgi:hypothetical protein
MAVAGMYSKLDLSFNKEPLRQHDLQVLRAVTRHHVAEHDE